MVGLFSFKEKLQVRFLLLHLNSDAAQANINGEVAELVQALVFGTSFKQTQIVFSLIDR